MTNQVNTLTNQDVMLDLYKIHAYIPNDAAGNPLTPFGNFCEGYESATKASEQRIQKLVEDNRIFVRQNVSLSKENAELQAHVNQLREALTHADEFIRNGIEFGYVRMPDESLKGIDSAHDTPEIIRKALLATPDESLQAHDDEVIEKCAKVATDACLVPPDGGTPMSYEVELCDAIAEVIRALKEVK